MAGWADLYAPPAAQPLGFTLGDISRQRGRLYEDDSITQYDRGVGFARAAHDTVGAFSARGAGRSSAKNLATNRMFEDYQRDTGKQRLGLSRALEDLDRQRRLATFGVLY